MKQVLEEQPANPVETAHFSDSAAPGARASLFIDIASLSFTFLEPLATT